MQRARLLIMPIRAPFALLNSPYSHLSYPKLPWTVFRNHRTLKTWMTVFNPKVQTSLPNAYWNITFRKFHHRIQNFSSPGSKFTISAIFGLSVVAGSIGLWPRIGFSTNDFEFAADDDQMDLMDGSHLEEDRHAFLTLVRKLLVPVFVFLTVLMNWGHPIIIAAKVTLIFFSTKPSPFSVYLFVEQLRHQAMRQHPFFYKFKPIHAKKVEVEDYIFLCLARVELKDQRYTLLGILGSWWVLPPSSWQEAFSTLTN